jgi:hypothetical protein
MLFSVEHPRGTCVASKVRCEVNWVAGVIDETLQRILHSSDGGSGGP